MPPPSMDRETASRTDDHQALRLWLRLLTCTQLIEREVRARLRERFARDFLKASGCRALAGYTTDVNWMDSMLADLLFLRRFYADPAPWRNLRQIHDSVLKDFAPARELGHVLHLREG